MILSAPPPCVHLLCFVNRRKKPLAITQLHISLEEQERKAENGPEEKVWAKAPAPMALVSRHGPLRDFLWTRSLPSGLAGGAPRASLGGEMPGSWRASEGEVRWSRFTRKSSRGRL